MMKVNFLNILGIDGSKLGHCQSGNPRAARRPSLASGLERAMAENASTQQLTIGVHESCHFYP
jgi:hypothetical protein